jgi:tRNA(Leu) C34 or U34 (ribose-2'-O)-methylase TrmL
MQEHGRFGAEGRNDRNLAGKNLAKRRAQDVGRRCLGIAILQQGDAFPVVSRHGGIPYRSGNMCVLTKVRASMGSLFSQKLTRCQPREFAEWAKALGVAVVGSSPVGLLDYRALRCRWPAALLIGSEKRGLSQHAAEIADFMVRIPMSGGCDSINVAVAAGVLLFELSSRRKGKRFP